MVLRPTWCAIFLRFHKSLLDKLFFSDATLPKILIGSSGMRVTETPTVGILSTLRIEASWNIRHAH